MSSTVLTPMLIPTRTKLEAERRRLVGPNNRSSRSVFIYRNAKYVGFFRRFREYVLVYSRAYALQPLLRHLHHCHNSLLEFLGFLILLFLSPFLILSAISLHLSAKFRAALVRRYVPGVIIADGASWRDPSHELGNYIVWVKGKVSAEDVRRRFETCQVPILRMRLRTKLGLQIWDPSFPVNIRSQILEAPLKYQGTGLNDRDGFQGQKSVLQQYITHLVSRPINSEAPWEIMTIPQPTLTKERTCCVLRFQRSLLRRPEVQELLGEIFSRSLPGHLPSSSPEGQGMDLSLSERYERFLRAQGQDLDEPMRIIEDFGQNLFHNLGTWLNMNIWRSPEDVRTLFNLRLKQWRFHPKKTLLRAAFMSGWDKARCTYEALLNFKQAPFYQDCKIILSVVLLILRALSFVPIEVINCCMHARRNRSGLQRVDRVGTRHVSWSALISKDLLEAIRERTAEASEESILLTAVSLALREYYVDTCIPNPRVLNVAVPSCRGTLLDSTGFKAVGLPTETLQLRDQIQKLGAHLENYWIWQLLGTYFAVHNLSSFLPRSLADLVLKQIVKAYPITLNYVNPEPSSFALMPTISLWGHPVEELTFWSSSEADFSVSVTVVKYLGTMRLTVVSPMKSIDGILSRRFGHHLNRLAEAVGVDRSLIPFSRKSSPATSNCTSPLTLLLNESKLMMAES